MSVWLEQLIWHRHDPSDLNTFPQELHNVCVRGHSQNTLRNNDSHSPSRFQELNAALDEQELRRLLIMQLASPSVLARLLIKCPLVPQCKLRQGVPSSNWNLSSKRWVSYNDIK